MPGKKRPHNPLRRKPNQKKTVHNNGTSPAAIELMLREAEALNLRLKGYSYAKIAEQLKLKTERVAWDYVDRCLGRSIREPLEKVRALELERLDQMMTGLMPAALSGRADAVHAILAIQARRARYAGLDAPVKVVGDVEHHHSGEIQVNGEIQVVFVKADHAAVIEHVDGLPAPET